MAQDRNSRGPQRGETQFTTQRAKKLLNAQLDEKNWGLVDWVLGCFLPLIALGLPLLFLGWLAMYKIFVGIDTSTTSSYQVSTSIPLPPARPQSPQAYLADFQIHDGRNLAGHSVLIVKDESIRIFTVQNVSEIPSNKRIAAAQGVVIDGTRPTVLEGAVTVTVSPLEQQDAWSGVLLAENGDLRQAYLKIVGESAFARPPNLNRRGWQVPIATTLPEVTMTTKPTVQNSDPVREVYIVGSVEAIHTPPLFNESQSTTNIIDLNLRASAGQKAAFERDLGKYFEEVVRYEHRNDPLFKEREILKNIQETNSSYKASTRSRAIPRR